MTNRDTTAATNASVIARRERKATRLRLTALHNPTAFAIGETVLHDATTDPLVVKKITTRTVHAENATDIVIDYSTRFRRL